MDNELKKQRKLASLTQSQAAEILKVSLRSYKTYENDKSKQETIKYQYMLSRLKEVNVIDESHGILTIDQIIELSSNILKNYPVHYCYLFGSYAKSRQTEKSDVDLLISTDVSGLKFYGLVDSLGRALMKKVDVIDTLQLANNQELLNEILKDGIKIYG